VYCTPRLEKALAARASLSAEQVGCEIAGVPTRPHGSREATLPSGERVGLAGARAWLRRRHTRQGLAHTDGGERSFAVGDTVIARRNGYPLGIFNGQRGTITHIDPDRRTVTVTLKQQQITVDADCLEAGGLDHGYAFTIHQAQGLTTGRTLILGNDSLYRESGYVALSRGRQRNDLYTATQPDNLDPVLDDGHCQNHRAIAVVTR
jgi:ATP-dependent exoDNAse (exonuclease V) alpha subunit